MMNRGYTMPLNSASGAGQIVFVFLVLLILVAAVGAIFLLLDTDGPEKDFATLEPGQQDSQDQARVRREIRCHTSW